MSERDNKGRFIKGFGYWTGKKRSPFSKEWKQKISNSNKGRKVIFTKEHCKKIGDAKRGKPSINRGRKRSPFSEEWRKHISDGLKGGKRTLETRKKMSLSAKGIPKSDEHIRKIIESRMKHAEARGYYFSEKTRKIWSEQRKGEKHWNWTDGSSCGKYGMDFNKNLKEQIRARDGYTCQECGVHQDDLIDSIGKKYKLAVHHIDYNKKNCNPMNLISLCRYCHIPTNNKRKKLIWTAYFQARMELLNMNILRLQEPEDIIIEMI